MTETMKCQLDIHLIDCLCRSPRSIGLGTGVIRSSILLASIGAAIILNSGTDVFGLKLATEATASGAKFLIIGV